MAKGRISKLVFQENKARQIFQKRTFLTPWSGCKKCTFFEKFDVLCFLETPVLRFALLPYYGRILLLFYRVFSCHKFPSVRSEIGRLFDIFGLKHICTKQWPLCKTAYYSWCNWSLLGADFSMQVVWYKGVLLEIKTPISVNVAG